jgi:hypothetical protein
MLAQRFVACTALQSSGAVLRKLHKVLRLGENQKKDNRNSALVFVIDTDRKRLENILHLSAMLDAGSSLGVLRE